MMMQIHRQQILRMNLLVLIYQNINRDYSLPCQFVFFYHAHSTTKCDSDENCLTKSDDTQDLGQNARDLSFHDKGQPENQQTDKQDTQDTANQNKPQNEQEKPAKPHQAIRQAEN